MQVRAGRNYICQSTLKESDYSAEKPKLRWSNSYGGPHLPRQNILVHGKTNFSTAKHTFSRQNILFHGKTYFFTAKHTFPRQNILFHGKTYFFTAKHTFSRQSILFHGKTFFFTAKHSFPRQNFLFHGRTFFSPANVLEGAWEWIKTESRWRRPMMTA